MGFADCNGGKLKSIYIKVKVPLSPLISSKGVITTPFFLCLKINNLRS